MNSYSSVGSGAGDAAALASVFTLASYYVNVATGMIPGQNVPAGTTVPIAQINTLANILSSCINSAGGVAGDGSPCGVLFTAATPSGGTTPANVISAGLNVADTPGMSVSTLFGLVTATSPYQPALTTAPQNFNINLLASSGLTFSPSGLTFPTTDVSSSSTPQVVTISNTGTKTIAFTLSNPGSDFSWGASDCGSNLVPGATMCTVQITFTPIATGERDAVFSIMSNAANSPQQIALTGTGAQSGGPITLSPSTLTFTQIGIPQTVTVTNNGTSPVTLGSISGYQTNDCGSVLAAQSICTISVEIYSLSATASVEMVSIPNSSASGTQTVTVNLPAAISTTASPALPLAFGDWAVGATSSAQAPPSIFNLCGGNGAALSGPNTFDFILNNVYNTCVENTTMGGYILFSPTGPGVRTATLALPGIGNIALSGNGIAAGPSFTISGYGSIYEPVGTSSYPTSLTVVNNGSVALLLSGATAVPTRATSRLRISALPRSILR
jgi:trimeric autotransporter adhesin